MMRIPSNNHRLVTARAKIVGCPPSSSVDASFLWRLNCECQWKPRCITSVTAPFCSLREPHSHRPLRFLSTLAPNAIAAKTSLSSTENSKKKGSAIQKTSLIAKTFDRKWSLPVTIYRGEKEQCIGAISNPPLVLLSGWGGMALDWGSVPVMLAAGLRCNVVVYDPRGLGQSISLCDSEEDQRGLDRNLSLEKMAMDVVAVIQSVQEQGKQKHHFRLLGVSMGGVMAQIVAAAATHGIVSKPSTDFPQEKFPDFSVESMILVATTHHHTRPFPDSPFLRCFDPWMRYSKGSEERRHCVERFFEALGDDFLRRPGRQTWKRRLVDGFLTSRMDKDILQTLLQRDALSSPQQDLEANADDLDIEGPPCLVLHGQDDRVVPFFHGEELYKALLLQPQSPARQLAHSFIAIPKCDHLCWITHGADVVEHVLRWYKEEEEESIDEPT